MASATFVHQFELGPWDNFVYFIGDRDTRQCAVVDPAWHARAILTEAERLEVTITHILCTHSHFDHVNQVEALLETLDVPVHMLAPEIEFSSFSCENLVSSRPGDTLELGLTSTIKMLHTPGHTPGSVSYLTGAGLITGDTLFINGCGRCDLVGGDPRTMFATLGMLRDRLPLQTVVYPGHNYGDTPTDTLDAQLRTNPFYQRKTLEDFVNHRMKGRTPGSALPDPPAWSPVD